MEEAEKAQLHAAAGSVFSPWRSRSVDRDTAHGPHRFPLTFKAYMALYSSCFYGYPHNLHNRGLEDLPKVPGGDSVQSHSGASQPS